MSRLSDKRVQKYFELARNASHYSNNNRAKLGSVLVYKGRIISIGYNEGEKTSPLQKEYNALRGFDPNCSGVKNTIHSECSCLIRARGANIDFSKAHLFTYRIKKDGSQGLARYCPACGGIIKSMGIKNVYYTLDEPGGWCYEKLGDE